MEVGDMIPAVLGTDSQGNTVTADRFAGTPLVIYFYPKDNTPGCTAEACSIQADLEAITARGYEVIGISKDSPASHLKFAAKYNLHFTLLSDESTEVNQAFGVWRKKKMAGREYMGTVRTTFITDADHRIMHVIDKVDTRNAGAQLLPLL